MGGMWNSLRTAALASWDRFSRLGRNGRGGVHATEQMPTLEEVTQDLFPLLHDVAPEHSVTLWNPLRSVSKSAINSIRCLSDRPSRSS